MEDLTEAIIAHTGCQDVEFSEGVYFLRFLQHDRYALRNIRTDGTNLNPVLSRTPENRTRTFYLHDNGSDLVERLNDVPLVFCVSSKLNEGVLGDYAHWTLGGVLHRDDGPAYVANYLNPERTIETMMRMYFINGVQHRDAAPSMELYHNYKTEFTPDGDPVIKFHQAVFECTYCPEEGDFTELLSWPYVKRLALNKGREFSKDGKREIAAAFANARWELPKGLNSGIYPYKMEMKGFHEFWDGDELTKRVIESVRSTWFRINEEDRREISPETLRRGGITSAKFDKQFRQLIDRVGFVDKPFYDDPMIELGVLTDLPKFLGDDDD